MPALFSNASMPDAHDVPQQLQPPATLKLILRASAKGDQIYVCQSEGGGYSWILKAPQAELFDESGTIGKHFAGPTWELNDGSRAVGKLLERSDSPDSHAIPWLLLSGVEHSGKGLLTRVTHIQRLNTKGGKAPNHCGPLEDGKEIRVPYTADYFFYGK